MKYCPANDDDDANDANDTYDDDDDDDDDMARACGRTPEGEEQKNETEGNEVIRHIYHHHPAAHIPTRAQATTTALAPHRAAR